MVWIGLGILGLAAGLVYLAYLLAALEDAVRQRTLEARLAHGELVREVEGVREVVGAAIDVMRAPDVSALNSLTCAVESQSKLVDAALKRVPKGPLPPSEAEVMQRMALKRGRKLLRQRLAARAAQGGAH